MPSLGTCLQLACILEATARKPGNVHPYANFDDCGYVDFLVSATVVAPVLKCADTQGVGAAVLEAVRQTRLVTPTNTNLGMVLLLAPLSAAAARAQGGRVREALDEVLGELSRDDARAVYQAIRLAGPAGLGTVDEQDVSGEPTGTLTEAMALAGDRDLVARQYANGFREIFDELVPKLYGAMQERRGLEEAIVWTHLSMMACHPDSLIARKRGFAEAQEAARRAEAVLDAGWPTEASGRHAFEGFDRWLRAAGNDRNPGTTADLLTAGLFVAMHRGIIEFPLRW